MVHMNQKLSFLSDQRKGIGQSAGERGLSAELGISSLNPRCRLKNPRDWHLGKAFLWGVGER
jgi:hypothetical protein